MLTGKELGAAIESARIKMGVPKTKLAEEFGVKPPSVQGWVKTGRIDKSKLMDVIVYFGSVVGPEHWGLRPGFSFENLPDDIGAALPPGRPADDLGLTDQSARLTKSAAPTSTGTGSQSQQAEQGRPEVDSNARRLAMDASPRSRSALEKIAGAAESGLLSEEDMLLLEVIADRLSSRKADQAESPHQRLRKKLTKNDPFSQ